MGLPNVDMLFGGAPEICDGIPTPDRPHGRVKPGKAAQRNDQLIKAMTAATVDAVRGEVLQKPSELGVPLIKSRKKHAREMQAEMEGAFSKMADPASAQLTEYLEGPSATTLAKEWSLSNPIQSGILAFDLEAPAKLLAPYLSPMRNQLPRVPGTGASRRIKVINAITGSGSGVPTQQGGFGEATTNVGPGGLSYVRPPYLQYSGYDVVLNYVSYGFSDSVSWQAEMQGQGYEDIRSLSNTALMYSTMTLEDRLFLYGRGTSANGYSGTLGVAPTFTLSAVSASITPTGTSTLGTSASVFVIVAPDAGDLLGTTGVQMHQGPASNVVTSVGTSAGKTAVQVTVTNDSSQVGAVGYNFYCASVASGPYYYCGRSGSSTGYITSQPSGGPSCTVGAADQSTSSNNFDGIIPSLAASGGYVTRLNAPLSTTNPGAEFFTALATVYESVKADPDVIDMNAFDRMQLSNAILNGNSNSAYNVYIQNDGGLGGVGVGAVVSTLYNPVTGKALRLEVEPWLPQGNAIVRSTSIPIPNSHVTNPFYWAGPQDMAIVQWAPTQFTFDSSSILIGTLVSAAPQFSALIQGISGVGISNLPPGPYGDA